MEFHVPLPGPAPDLAAIEDALRALDPAVVLDRDPLRGRLRVSTSLGVERLCILLGEAGYPVRPQEVEPIPSVCCGSCSG